MSLSYSSISVSLTISSSSSSTSSSSKCRAVLAEDLRGVNLGKEREERKEMGGFCEERREREAFLGERGNGNENGREEEEKSLLTVPVAAAIF